MTDAPITVRPADISDWDFIRKSWRATFLNGGPAVQGADKQHFFDEMTRVFAAICPTAEARMACDPEDADNVLGFAVYTGPELHFVYVLQDFRRMGFVPRLLSDLNITRYTFSTIQGVRRLRPLERGWAFTPRFTLKAA